MDVVQIEQMNKVRVSLGMAPLPVPGAGPQFKSKLADERSDSEESDDMSTVEKRQAAAGDNWQKLESERLAKVERQRRKDGAKKAREVAARFAKLQGKGLGEVHEGEEVDTKTWLLQQKKRQRKIEKARKLEEELAAREQQAEYTSRDLAGVKVGHEVDEFDTTAGEQILTLKDAAIGEESEEDELENAELNAKRKLQEKLELKKKKPVYNPNESEDNRGILAQYDEEIDGKKQKRFTLDGQGSSVEAEGAVHETVEVGKKRVQISLDILKDDAPASDYLDPTTFKVKKVKNSKKDKKTRQKAADEDDIFPISELAAPKQETEAMEVDSTSQANGVSKKRALEFDDDDLQAKLAEQRRQALKKRKKTYAAELARQMREEASATPMETNEDDDEEDGPGLVIDETSEFIQNLQRPTDLEETGGSKVPQPRKAHSPDEDDDGDTSMASQNYADNDDASDRESSTPAPPDNSATGLEEEASLNQGVGASLNLLRNRGLISNPTADNQNARDRQRAQFLVDKKQLIEKYDARAREQREADRASGRFNQLSARDRDAYAQRQNEDRERYLSKLQADMFNKDYKPDVKLKYTDDFGRDMNQKEAFKHLSHMFHGKGSGKGKTDKTLTKIANERRMQAKGMLDVSGDVVGGMLGAAESRSRKQKSAGVRLQ